MASFGVFKFGGVTKKKLRGKMWFKHVKTMGKNTTHVFLDAIWFGCQPTANKKGPLPLMQGKYASDNCCVCQDITISPANLDFGQASATRKHGNTKAVEKYQGVGGLRTP